VSPSDQAGAALVVGGGSGIGSSVAERLRGQGARVVVWDIAGEPDVRCDVRDPAAVDAALEETVELVGVPESVTVTAGVGQGGMLVDEPVEAWDRTMEINARGPWLVLRALARAMIDSQTQGSMVATSSVSAHLVDRGMGLYCASKAALSMIVQVAAFEWARFGIRVNAVGPGVTQTPMLGRAPVDSGWLAGVRDRTPLGRLGQSGDIAQTILSLHEMEWVTGQIIDCDGGLSLYSPIDAFSESVPPKKPD
jgi:NAD(P)-dependent dehydrogenase (short-subunit alcohol dehydrogenase family)